MIHQPRTALVTGGARRIGAAIVRDLAKNGFAVAIHCNRSRAEAEALAAEINRHLERRLLAPEPAPMPAIPAGPPIG